MKTTSYSKIYRIIHWLIAFAILFMLLTIFLRLTWMNKYNVAEIIQDYLTNVGVSLTDDQTIVLAKNIRRPMWNWHIYIGYVLTGLFSIRLLLPFFGEMKFQNPLEKGLTTKLRVQKWTYIIFYIGILISLVTGLMMEFGPEELAKRAENIHVLALYYLIPFIVIHLLGVLIAEFTDQKGIIYRIIRGSEVN
jgi:cytochrome b561